jgi:DNA-binding Xre family transcriptional regulator
MTKNPYIGSSLDDLLEEDGMLEQVDAVARKRVIAWQLSQAMAKKELTKTQMAQAMKTSRACLNRLLDPDNPSVTLLTLERAAVALGMKLKIEIVETDD